MFSNGSQQVVFLLLVPELFIMLVCRAVKHQCLTARAVCLQMVLI